MTTAHEAIAAYPVGAAADKALARAMDIRRFAYCLAASDDVTGFVAVDPDAGTIPLYIVQSNVSFQYDSTDTTTAHDGVTCLVTSDGKRYKSATIDYPWSVLSLATSAQPATPSVGDRYLVPPAATGADWAGKDGDVAIYTAAGWRFAVVPIGRALYVEDTNTRYYRDADGDWVAGVGTVLMSSGSIPPSALIGGAERVRFTVENQTTATQPTVTNGVSYVIASGATGAVWAGNSGKIAHGENGVWVIYTPAEGWRIYDKGTDSDYLYDGTSWTLAGGQFAIAFKAPYTASATWTKPAKLIGIEVEVVGAGGNDFGTGGTTSFGAHVSATGGTSAGTAGTGSGGDRNFSGVAGGGSVPGQIPGLIYGGFGQGGPSAGGPGGGAVKYIAAADLGATEAITIGLHGGSSSGSGGGGLCLVKEYTRA